MSYALGIDIGGTKIAIGVIAADGRVLAQRLLPTDSRQEFQASIRSIVGAVSAALEESGVPRGDVAGVGVGCAGPVDPQRGEINNPYTLPGWEGRNIVKALTDGLDLPVWLENDADAAAIGEYYFGAGQRAERLVVLTVGTGVGGAIVIDGDIYRGADGQHPEIGHIPISVNGPDCYCGRKGCLESLISGRAIAAAGREYGFTDAASVFSAASHDHRARDILSGAQGAIEAAMWSVVHFFLPTRIVLGGGLVESHEHFFIDAARRAVSHACLLAHGTTTVAPAGLGNLAGMVGAGRWALEHARPRALAPLDGAHSSHRAAPPAL